eukprot:CAMPEP_0179290672 /NCGR_PEP_ID=MMETSP0797-20121207/41939_1 /TAXON_ID=47934 /ORGANISM="Dinophysis acuminata, Strain DAEP01" /LENGTH=115 /DNA_ID=CAMNT_0020999717 /DNA_START=15 /DNA_END=362 /DNA_ORIENTATION=-
MRLPGDPNDMFHDPEMFFRTACGGCYTTDAKMKAVLLQGTRSPSRYLSILAPPRRYAVFRATLRVHHRMAGKSCSFFYYVRAGRSARLRLQCTADIRGHRVFPVAPPQLPSSHGG